MGAAVSNGRVPRLAALLDAWRVDRRLYAWWTRPPSQRALDDAQLTAHIARIHERTKRCYGPPRVHAQLRPEGVRVGRKR